MNMPFTTETIKQVAQASALAISVLYFFGFFAANTYLYKHGFFETDFVRPRYLVLGFAILICLVAFYFSTARPIFVIRNSLSEDIKLIFSKKRSPFFKFSWALFCFFTSFTNITFLAITGATIACLIVAQKSAPAEYWVAMFIAFFVVFTLENLKVGEKFKILFTIIERTIQVAVIYIYFRFSTWEYTSLTLLLAFAGAGFALNLALHDRETRHVTLHKNLYDAFYASIGVLTFSIAFGLYIYEQLKPEFSGGEPINANLIFAQKLNETAPIKKLIDDKGTVPAKIIFETDSFIFFRTETPSNAVYRVAKAEVLVAITDTPSSSKKANQNPVPQAVANLCRLIDSRCLRFPSDHPLSAHFGS